MREITASGETVDEAIQSALEQLNLSKDEVDIEVIDEGKKGFLGIFGSVRAVVKVREKRNNVHIASEFLKDVCNNMGVHVHIDVEEDDRQITYRLSGENIAILIGKRGRTLNALQYLTQLVLNKESRQYTSVIVDAEGYRERRRETLIDLAHKMANKAQKINRKVALDPMPAYERKIIHSALQDVPNISTYSDGKEPHRYIIISPEQ
ncbi:MAG TPA: RNA-binding cell elongation regulator Jag/EloR [Pseudogracilibacillus sp.]|nr:RNA-binding cell elongation regulator Jag/EloR [Pseudogracilibacillus sp.]